MSKRETHIKFLNIIASKDASLVVLHWRYSGRSPEAETLTHIQSADGWFRFAKGRNTLFALHEMVMGLLRECEQASSTSIYRKKQLKRLNLNFEAISLNNIDEEQLKNKSVDDVQLSGELSLLVEVLSSLIVRKVPAAFI